MVGSLTITNVQDLNVDSLTYSSVAGTSEAISNVDVGDDLALTIDGDLTQSAAVIGAGDTSIDATGHICLTNEDNAFSGDIDLSAGGDLVLATSGSLDMIVELCPGAVRLASLQMTSPSALTSFQINCFWIPTMVFPLETLSLSM